MASTQESMDQQFAWLRSTINHPRTARNTVNYVTSLLSRVEKKNSWQLSEAIGHRDPYKFQNLLLRADWNADDLQLDLARKVQGILGDKDSVIAVDETGFLKKGNRSFGVARQYSGTAGRVENCQIGVFLSYATSKGHTLIDRELYAPKNWCAKGGETFKTKLDLAREMLQRAFDQDVCPQWVTGDCVYGSSYKFRSWLEGQGQSYVMGVASNQSVTIGFGQYRVGNLFERYLEDWRTLPSGVGTKGLRKFEWKSIEINHPYDSSVKRWAICRRSIKDGSTSYFMAFAPAETKLETLVFIAGRRWTIEECFKTAKNEVGLDQYQVRSKIAWYRHITLAMVAQAMLLMTRIVLSTPPQQNNMLMFKKKRGLASN